MNLRRILSPHFGERCLNNWQKTPWVGKLILVNAGSYILISLVGFTFRLKASTSENRLYVGLHSQPG